MSQGFEPIDFRDYHEALPVLLAEGRGAMAASGTADLDAIAFRIRETGESYTYCPSQSAGIDVVPGDDRAATVVDLPHSCWAGLVGEKANANVDIPRRSPEASS